MAALEASAGGGSMPRWAIAPERVIAHSDMAPGRKADPGARFDWRRLARAGLVGLARRRRGPARGFGDRRARPSAIPSWPRTCCWRPCGCGSGPGRAGPLDATDRGSRPPASRACPLTRTRRPRKSRGRADGRMTAGASSPRGKSGLHEATVPGNARPGQPEGKRHREETALRPCRVRVKRWGKSPPRDRATGPARQAPPGAMPNRDLARAGPSGDTAAGTLQPERSGLAA